MSETDTTHPAPNLRRRLRAFATDLAPDLGLITACLLLIAFGVFLRFNDVNRPATFIFDEHHFVGNARNYIAGLPDTNDHPPFGKFPVAVSILLLGDNPLAWRLTSLAAGILSIVLAHRLASHLFRDHRAGWIAAAFVAADGFFLSYSRIALLDGTLAMLMLASALAIVKATRVWHVAIASVLVGLAVGVKFSGIVMVPALAWVIVARHRTLRWSLPVLLLVPLTYVAQFSLGLHLSGRPAGPLAVLNATQALVEHHQALTAMTHPYTSKWFTWLVPTRPIPMIAHAIEGGVRMMTSLGHPLLWWLVNLALAVLLVRLPQRFVAAVAHRTGVSGPSSPSTFLGPSTPWAWLALFWLLPILPWMVSHRDSYIYHYLPAYGFGLVLAAGLLFSLYRRKPTTALVALAIVGVVAAFYAPVWTQLPLTRQAYLLRVPFEMWQ